MTRRHLRLAIRNDDGCQTRNCPPGHEKILGGIFPMPMSLIKDVIWMLLIAAACVGFVALGKEVWDLLT